jgi:gliding motility-associated-like protein
MKNILIIICILLGIQNAFSQPCPGPSCNSVIAYANGVHVDTLKLCLGDSILLSQTGSLQSLNNNFNNNSVGSNWTTATGAVFTNPCGPGPNSTSGTYFWFGNTAPANNRILETIDFDMTGGGNITFDFRMAIQAQPAPCEGPDQPHEGVALQYSTNGGTTWVTIGYFNPSSAQIESQVNCALTPNLAAGYNHAFTVWNTYNFPIPVGAQVPCVRFRWAQGICPNGVSGPGFDHWGLDNVAIGMQAGTINPNMITWSHGGPGTAHWVKPTANTTYVLTLSAVGTVCKDSIVVLVDPVQSIEGVMTVASPNDLILCNGDSTFIFQNGAAGVQVIFEKTTDGINWIPFVPSNPNLISTGPLTQTTSYRVRSISNNCGGMKTSAPITITVIDYPILSKSHDAELCQGDSVILFVNTRPDVSVVWTPSNLVQNPISKTVTAYSNTAPGVHYMVATVFDQFGCITVDSIRIQTNPIPVAQGVVTNSNCGSDNGRIDIAASNGTPPYWYTIENGALAVDSFYQFLAPGDYTVLVQDSKGCRAYDLVTVIEFNNIQASFTYSSFNDFYKPGPPPSGATPFELNLVNTSTGTFNAAIWDFGNGTGSNELTNTSVIYKESGTYAIQLIVYNVKPECADTFIIDLEAIGNSDIIEVPNVISPNGDGYNDAFDPKSLNLINLTGTIYNRWGKKVYGWNDKSLLFKGKNDDGEELPEGTYFYLIEGEGIDGQRHKRQGFIKILR